MGLAVDHDPAGAADAFSAIAVEGDGLATAVDEALVHEVEHLEERHLGVDVVGVVGLEPAGAVGTVLAPDLEREVHVELLLVTALGQLHVFELESLFVELLGLTAALPLPRRGVGEVLVVA